MMRHEGVPASFRQQEMLDAATNALLAGEIIAVCGGVGSGKTTMLRQLRRRLNDEAHVVAQSIAVDKTRVTPKTLVSALLYDLSTDERVRLPARSKARERALRDLVEKQKRPITLFIDDAHDLPLPTLIGITCIREIVECGGATLSVALAGRPTLQTMLRQQALKNGGYRTQFFTLESEERW